MNRSVKAGVLLLSGLVLFVCWYVVAADYDYGMLAGTYKFSGSGVRSILYLHSDGSFDQELVEVSRTSHAIGKWRRIGEGGVNLSINFLRVPGSKNYIEMFPDHPDGRSEFDQSFYGHFEKILGVYPTLQLDGEAPVPTFYRSFLK